MKMIRTFYHTILHLFLYLFLSSPLAYSKDITLSWLAPTEAVDGYFIYFRQVDSPASHLTGTLSQQGPSPLKVGNTTLFKIRGLEEKPHCFYVSSYKNQIESQLSLEFCEDNPFPQIIKINISK